MASSLQGKTALVTGASRGIGRARWRMPARTSWFTMAVLRKMQNLSSPTSA
jgi:NAD(P)-dependent dehydrogenase (short-subunit alcohol dehydrogenase family)